MNVVLTIGYSTHSLEAFVALLQHNGVTALADVRSTPYGRSHPQFNREALERDLMGKGIKYVFLGRELGGRPDDPSCYENGRVQYARLARTRLFHRGIDRVLRGARSHRVALMCAEKEPLDCHRTLLVSRALVERGVAVQHILWDGRLESHSSAMERLIGQLRLPHQDLFRSKDELIAQALTKQEQRVAYVNQNMASDAPGDPG